ncbi:MAG: flagellar export chaperone FliS [Acidobacteria bacterium]|nr:flagellar export chaperone FliS [Acidobacteriota bacterium]
MPTYNALNPHQNYLENSILTASKSELVRILYRVALQSVRDARQALAAGDIGTRGRAVSKAGAAVSELICSLDLERGGAFALELRELYGFVQHRLTQAHLRRSGEMLAEAEGILETLRQGLCGAAAETAEQTATPAEAATGGGLIPGCITAAQSRVLAAFSAC